MELGVKKLVTRGKTQISHDVRTDPYLPYILLLATVLAGFWFWHLAPNFATRDEIGRIFDPISAAGHFVANPGLEGLQEGVAGGLALGATTYLYGLALVPVFIAVVVTGQFATFASVTHGTASEFGTWQALPAWFWTWSILLVRLTNVLFAIGCVYLTYRIGVAMRDRTTGRLAAVFLTLSFGFLMLAHEGGEDMPALFFVLFVVYLGFRYIETGEEITFLAGCALGGVALAFKLTAAPVVGLLAVAYVLRARRSDSGWFHALARPRLIGMGLVLGAVVTILGFPSALVGGPGPLLDRLMQGAARGTHSHGPNKPIWWWFLRNYLNGLGLPLFVGVVGGVAASLIRLRKRSLETDGAILLLAGILLYISLFSMWQSFRVHHILPTFPLLVLLLASALARLHNAHTRVARPLIAVLLVTAGAYAIVGDVGYAMEPHDQAVHWLNANTQPNASLEVYIRDVHDGAIPHGMQAKNHNSPKAMVNITERCPDYIELNRRNYRIYNPNSWRSGSPAAVYLHNLRAGDKYPYRIVAEFGKRPGYLRNDSGFYYRLPTLLRVGLKPRTLQYGDEQQLSDIRQYIAIFKRTDSCN